MQIVLGPVDPSQSKQSCLSSSALGSRDALIRPDSEPREMMGRETTHSTHVTRCAAVGRHEGGVWGVGWDGMGKQEGSEAMCPHNSRCRNHSPAWHNTDSTHTHTHTLVHE